MGRTKNRSFALKNGDNASEDGGVTFLVQPCSVLITISASFFYYFSSLTFDGEDAQPMRVLLLHFE